MSTVIHTILLIIWVNIALHGSDLYDEGSSKGIIFMMIAFIMFIIQVVTLVINTIESNRYD